MVEEAAGDISDDVPVRTADGAHPTLRDNEIADRLFAGSGELRARCRAFDWGTTALGPVSSWSQSLRTTASTVLASRSPMFLWWGPELVQIYNDAYRPSFGENGRHPRALGMRGRECWTDIWEAISPQIEQVMTTGEATWHVDQHLPIERNGRVEDVWWTYSYSPVHDDDGSIAGTLVVCQETTQRVIGEHERGKLLNALEIERSRLAEVFRQAPSFLAVLRGPEHVFERVNDAYYGLVGHRDIVGRSVWEALPEVRDQGFIDILDGVLKTGDAFVGREVPIMLARTAGAAAEERFVNFVYQPLAEADGVRSRIVAHGTDVTEQVRARHEVERLLRAEREARAEAESANRAKSEFLAVMSHELRTPLNAIAGYVQLLDMGIHGPVTDAQHEALDRVARSQQHLLGLINDVLNLARIEAGRVDYSIEDVALADVVNVTGLMIEPQLMAKRLTYRTTVENGVAARADRDKVQQILLNLLTNAVKFTPAGGSITVDVATRQDVPNTVFLRVTDTGIGIARDKQSSVFEPFVQADPSRTRRTEGTGLGLAISRDLAHGMGADLSVRSVEGKGSTFILSLPVPIQRGLTEDG